MPVLGASTAFVGPQPKDSLEPSTDLAEHVFCFMMLLRGGTHHFQPAPTGTELHHSPYRPGDSG